MRRAALVGSMLVIILGSIGVRSATAQAQSRSLTLEASDTEVDRGDAVVLTGKIEGPASCIDGVLVFIEFDFGDDAIQFNPLNVARSASDGTFTETVLAADTGRYQARVEASGNCSEATSPAVFVLTRIDVVLTAADNAVSKGSRARLTAVVSPQCDPRFPSDAPPQEISLHRFVGGAYVKVASKPVDEECSAIFRRRIRTTEVFIATFPKLQSLFFNYGEGTSEPVPVGLSR